MSVTLSRRVRRDLQSGEPLPDVWECFKQAGIRLRRSCLHMVAGQTGCGKTLFMLAWVKALKVPTLYFSNDSSELTVISRLLADAVQRPASSVEEEVMENKDQASELLAGLDHVRWVFNPGPTLDDIDAETAAFQEVWGDYPHLIVIDILKLVSYYEQSGDTGSLDRILQYCHQLSRNTGACVIVVHHSTEAVKADPCPPRSAILQKQNAYLALILTVALQAGSESHSGGSFFVAPVKNRHGYSDPSGKNALRLAVNPETCTFWEE